MFARLLPYLTGCLLAACSFDVTGVLAIDSGNNDVDAPSGDTGTVGDAGPCDDNILVQLSINGFSEQLPTGRPYAYALPGDIVELSARGSCARQGALSYEWQISPIDATRSTAVPDLTSEVIRLYPALPEDYTVTLTVTAGDLSTSRTVLGIRAYEWQRRDGLPGGQDVRGLDASADTLWIAGAVGAHRLPLGADGSGDEFVDIGAGATGDAIVGNLGPIRFSAAEQLLWLAEETRRDDLWRVQVGQTPVVSTLVNISGDSVLGDAARVYDIFDYAPGIGLATSEGVTRSDDGLTFFGTFTPEDSSDVRAIAASSDRHVTGGRRLYDMTNSGVVFDPFTGTTDDDNAIRSLAMDTSRNELWIATDGHGAARIDVSGDLTVLGIYDTATDALPTDRLRDIAIERVGPFAGDVWIATNTGVIRYIRERDTWLLMGNAHGLRDRINVRAIVIDETDGRRAVYAGTSRGLVSVQMQSP